MASKKCLHTMSVVATAFLPWRRCTTSSNLDWSQVSMVSSSLRRSVCKSILAPLRATVRSCENLQRLPLVHSPRLKYSHTTDFGSTPGSSCTTTTTTTAQSVV